MIHTVEITEQVKRLTGHLNCVNKYGISALHLAVYHNKHAAMFLIRLGANVNVRDKLGGSPYEWNHCSTSSLPCIIYTKLLKSAQ